MLKDRLFQAASNIGGVGEYFVGDDNSTTTEVFLDNSTGWTNVIPGSNEVRGLASDGDFIYSGSYDDNVRKININTGITVWTNTEHTSDVYDVAVDASGNVYSASTDASIKKINPSGSTIWTRADFGVFPVVGICVDLAGNVIACSQDNTWKKYNSSGTLLFTNTESSSIVSSVAVDATGDVYSADAIGVVRKTTSANVPVWNYTTLTGLQGLAVHSNGNVYVSGTNGQVTKLNNAGAFQWTVSISSGLALNIATDPDENIYVTSFDNAVYILEPTAGGLIQTYPAGTQVFSICTRVGLYPIFYT
jgi:hypothetical protein